MKLLRAFFTLNLIIVFLACVVSALAQDHYVVIGTFADEANALRFTNNARRLKQDAKYQFNPDLNSFFVHVMKTTNKDDAFNQSVYLESQTSLKGSWVLSTNASNKHSPTSDEISIPSMQSALSKDKNVASNGRDLTYLTPAKKDDQIASNLTAEKSNIEKNKPSETRTSSGMMLTCSIETSDGRSISGEALIVDPEKGKTLATFKPGEKILIKTDKNGMLYVVCNIFGYKGEIKTLNTDDPEQTKGIKPNKQGVLVVSFKLVRVAKGDRSIMSHVSFLKDATILKSSSTHELDELLAIMVSNPLFEISIRSHCQGTDWRSITTSDGRNYFDSLNTSSQKASPEKLTRLRAEVIKSYLADHGIEQRRITVVSLGGEEMLTEETVEGSDWIEIEVLEDK